MKKWLAGAVALALSASLTACTAQQQGFKVGLVTDTGGLNDQSFNAAANRGLQKAKDELKIVPSVIESAKPDDYVPNLSGMADGGNQLIWGIGFMMQDAVASVAKSHPDTKFAIIDAVVTDAPNVASVTFKEEEGSFLVGVIAAKATQSKKIGFVGGVQAPIIEKFEYGFRAGVKSVDPTIEVQTAYAGSFTDAARGKSIAEQMIGNGVDVIYHASGGTGMGVIEAVKAAGKFAVGVDSDQNHLAPENVITSMMKRVDVAVYDITRQAVEGKFTGGQVVTLGVKEDGVGYAPSTLWHKLPEGTQALVDSYKQAIIDGKITVPATRDQFDAFVPVQP